MVSTTSTGPVRPSKLRPFFRFLLWGLLLTAFCAAGVKGILRHYEVPLGLRVLLALAPLLPFAYGIYAYWRDTRGRADELDHRIWSDAGAAGFYGFFLIITVMDMLESGGVLRGFAWTKDSLTLAMLASLGVGWAWSVRRFR